MRTKELLLIVAVCAALDNVYAYAGDNLRYFSNTRKWNIVAYTYNYVTEKRDTVYLCRTFDGPTMYDGRECYMESGATEEMKKYLLPYYSEDDNGIYFNQYYTNRYENQPGLSYEWQQTFYNNLKVGEMGCEKVDSIMVNGVIRRRWWFDSKDVWVEGIGSAFSGPFGGVRVEASWLKITGKLLSVYDGDECIFTYEDFTKEAYHSEPVVINAVQVSNSPVPLFDLSGRRIQGEPRKGVYVRGGKKYVKK